MKRPRFLLVHDPEQVAKDAARARVAPGKKKTASTRSAGRKSKARASTTLGVSAGRARQASAPSSGLERVGVWDLGAWLSGLPHLVERYNAAQRTFEFYAVTATVPVGTIRSPVGVAAWYHQLTNETLRAAEKRELENNVIADDFFPLADVVRKDLGLDYLVGLTPSMVAGTDGDELYWNHFSTYDRRTILASTHDLRDFAAESERPFEVFLGTVVLAQLLVAGSRELGYHENRGCLFDYNESRVSLQATIAELRIEPACLKLVAPRYRKAAAALLELLRHWHET